MANPTIKELNNKEKYELIAELNHQQIKEFVVNRLAEGGRLVKVFMIYQVIMIALGIVITVHSVLLSIRNHHHEPLLNIIVAVMFSFTALVIIHELLHGVAIKLTGAPKINYGAYFKKFIFYAEADRHVLNNKQFTFIALTPLVTIKVISIIGIILFFNYPAVYFITFIMCAHSLFCAGDIGLLSIFSEHGNDEIYTYDVKDEKKSYYFKKKMN
ncbi:MAG: DUF3267 domain-containing protein [Bacteroidota bacterium]